MNRSSRKIAAASVLAAALAAAPAVWLVRAETGQVQGKTQPQARQARVAQSPVNERPDAKPETNPARRGPGAAVAPRGVRPIDQPVSPDEWVEISEFMAQYMPWRIETVQRMPEGAAKERVKRLLGARYRGLRTIQNRDPESFEARLGQLKVEDQIYKLVSQIGGADPQRRQQIQDELRPEVASLVDVDLSERQRRVDRLEKELRRQKKLLDQDTADRENIIERRLARFLDWGTHWPRQRGPANGPAAAPGGVNATPDGAAPGQGNNPTAAPSGPGSDK
jgi:hypothetical protein